MTKPAADASAVLTAEDTLVLASTATPVEMELIMGWLGRSVHAIRTRSSTY